MVAILALPTAAFTADDLPKSDPDETFEVEPPLLIPNRDSEPDPEAIADHAPVQLSLERLEKDFERSKRNAGGAERLFRIGVLAKVEVEQRNLRMVRLEAELENARLALLKEEFAIVEKGLAAGEVSKAELARAEAALGKAISVAQAATVKRERAELEVAEANVQRQRKLLSLGSGRKSEVARAEQKLADLKASKN